MEFISLKKDVCTNTLEYMANLAWFFGVILQRN